MTLRLADTALLIAILNPTRPFSRLGARLLPQNGRSSCVPVPVLLEVGNYFGESALRPQVMAFLRRLQEDPRVECVQLDGVLLREAVDFYAARAHQEWGLTDRISFLQKSGIVEALSTDHHFEQAGSRILMKS